MSEVTRQQWTLVVAVVATSMAFIDATALNVALPAIQRAFAADASELLWMLNGYAVPLTALLLAAGSLGDRVGRKRVFGIGILVFAVASLACGLALTAHFLIGARVLQGVGAALMLPGSIALLTDVFPRERLGRAIGVWSAWSVVAMACGPPLGGVLAGLGWWRGIFFLNLPLALIALSMLVRVRVANRPPVDRPLDWPGAALTATVLGGLSFGLVEAPTRGLGDGVVLSALLIAAVALVAFVQVERKAADPILPLGIFRSRVLTLASSGTILLYTSFHGMMVFLPLYLIQLQGYSPRGAGLAQLPVMAGVLMLSPWAGRLVDRVGPRPLLVSGAAAVAVSLLLFALPGLPESGSGYLTRYFPAFALLGAGMGLTIAPLSTTIMNSLEGRRSGLASGLNSALSRLSSVLAVAVLGGLSLILFGRTLVGVAVSNELDVPTTAALLAQAARLGEAQVPAGLSAAVAAKVQNGIELGFLATFRAVAAASATLAAAAVLAAVFLPSGRIGSSTRSEGAS